MTTHTLLAAPPRVEACTDDYNYAHRVPESLSNSHAGQGYEGQGRTGHGRTGNGYGGQGRAGHGRTGHGRTGHRLTVSIADGTEKQRTTLRSLIAAVRQYVGGARRA